MPEVSSFDSPERLGLVWLEMSEPGKGFTLGPKALGEARKLLAPIGALQLLADNAADMNILLVSDQLQRKIAAVQAVIDISDSILGDDPLGEHNSIWGGAEQDAADGILYRLKERIEYLRERALEAEKLLKEAGGMFDPKTKLVTFQGPKGRPWLQVNRCIVDLFLEMAGKDGTANASKKEICEKISVVLKPYFPSERLDPGPRGVIAKAIEKYLQA